MSNLRIVEVRSGWKLFRGKAELGIGGVGLLPRDNEGARKVVRETLELNWAAAGAVSVDPSDADLAEVVRVEVPGLHRMEVLYNVAVGNFPVGDKFIVDHLIEEGLIEPNKAPAAILVYKLSEAGHTALLRSFRAHLADMESRTLDPETGLYRLPC